MVEIAPKYLNYIESNGTQYIDTGVTVDSTNLTVEIDGVFLNSEGCYIATMVYGDYNHPQVMVLRRYRDEYLLKSFCGRCFVNIYYYLSPKVVRILHNKKRVNIFIRWWLDRYIKRKLKK